MRYRTFVSAALLGVLAAVLNPSAARAQPAPGITLDVKPIVGSEALALSGTSAGGRTIRVTLYATYSRDLPDVVLSRRTVFADDRGNYQTTVPLAPGFFRGALITVVTTALPSGAWASAHYTVGPPNVTVPPDNLPHNVQR